MGLSHFPGASDGVLTILVINTVLSISTMKNLVRSVFQVTGSSVNILPSIEDGPVEIIARQKRISTTQFKNLRDKIKTDGFDFECCVCLCDFEAEEEVSELSCKHFFHSGCLDKWFRNNHTTCPICRSIAR